MSSKFNVFVINEKSYEYRKIEVPFVPRIGDKIALFYHPLPLVTDVIPLHQGMEVETNMKQMVTSIGLTWEQFVENYSALIFVS